MNRRSFLHVTAASPLLAAPPSPNILWIIAEDFSPDLGCYGNHVVNTPNLDRLAAEGVRFTNAFVTGPVCSASRSAIATGMYQTSIGAHQHRSHRHDGYQLPGGVRVLTDYLRAAGYYTANVTTAAPGVRGTGKTDFNFNAPRPFDGTDWNQRGTGQPFYAQINFTETHRAFHRCPERPIDRRKAVPPPYYPDTPAAREDWAMYLETAQNLDLKVGKALERLRQENLIEETVIFFFGDHGRPMPRGKQFLYDEGIRIPLIVRIPDKLRPPEFHPGSVREDFVSAIDITATSLAAARIEVPRHMQGQPFLWGSAQPRDCIFAARDRCDETPDRIRTVRDKRFKYIRNFHPERPWAQPNNYKDTAYPMLRLMRQLHRDGKLTPDQARFLAPRRPAEELYDLTADPHELANLAGKPEHRATLVRMRGQLDKWIAETRDQGEKPESPVPPEEFQYRSQVDGWCTRPFSEGSKRAGLYRVVCSGKANGVLRSCVTDGGDLTLEFRARSTSIRPRRLFWGTIDAMAFQPGQDNWINLECRADGAWHEYSVPFRIQGFLGVIGLDLGPGEGVIEFDWIRLRRAAPGAGEIIENWDFAP